MQKLRETWESLLRFLEPYPWVATVAGLGLVAVVALMAFYLTRRYLLRIIEKLIRRSRISWDDTLLDRNVFSRASLAAPILAVYYGIALVPNVPEALDRGIERLALGALTFVVLLTLSAVLTTANEIYQRFPISRGRPIKGYVQIVKIFVWVVGSVMVVALLLDRSPLVFVTGIGAMTAVLLLIFRDTILSLVASIQIVSNDMVRLGDWIEMPRYGADGDIVDIALHTVKVQNWDKTITTIPTYKLIDESFRNWRGMSESGGRRIKRSIHIDLSSIRFLSEEDIERFSRFALLQEHLQKKLHELEESNRALGDEDLVVNARRLTNIGTFRAYLVNYLRQHPRIHTEGMTLMVRQLDPGPEGLPIQIYAFTNTTAWVEYEGIQSDIFDHIAAMIPEFGLRVFQKPAGSDLAHLRPGGSAG